MEPTRRGAHRPITTGSGCRHLACQITLTALLATLKCDTAWNKQAAVVNYDTILRSFCALIIHVSVSLLYCFYHSYYEWMCVSFDLEFPIKPWLWRSLWVCWSVMENVNLVAWRWRKGGSTRFCLLYCEFRAWCCVNCSCLKVNNFQFFLSCRQCTRWLISSSNPFIAK